MSINIKKTSLLDELMLSTKCSYLSDLHVPEYAAQVRAAVMCIDAEEHSADEWNAAIAYITGAAAQFATACAAAEFLCEALLERAEAAKKEEQHALDG